MLVSWVIRKLGHGTGTTLSTKRFDTQCRRFHLLMVTVNRENWLSSGGGRASIYIKGIRRRNSHWIQISFALELFPAYSSSVVFFISFVEEVYSISSCCVVLILNVFWNCYSLVLHCTWIWATETQTNLKSAENDLRSVLIETDSRNKWTISSTKL